MEQPHGNTNVEAPSRWNTQRVSYLKKKFAPGFKFSLVFSIIFSLICLIIGAMNKHKCPIKREIPSFLISKGVLGLTAAVVSYLVTRDYFEKYKKAGKYVESVLHTADVFLFGFGMYCVISVYKPSFNPSDDPNYCNKTIYMFSFVYIIMILTIYIAILLGVCCFLCCVCFVVATDGTECAEPESAQAMKPDNSSSPPGTNDK